VLISIALSALFYYVPFIGKIIPSELHIVVCAVAASVLMAIIAPIKIENDTAEEGGK
jgi:uncharacterized membrane protein